MELPKKIGRYEIIKVIGQGMRMVYKARDPEFDRLVMLNVWRFWEGKPAAHERWFREMKRYGLLTHPNLVVAYDVGECDGMTYLATELLDGEPLVKVIPAGTWLSLLQRIAIIQQISGGLQFVHDHDIVHRDVKPANIFLSKDGTAKLVELTPTLDELEGPLVQYCLTVAYASPEVLQGEVVDGRADVFSLGCTFYELVEGRRPFEAASGVDVVRHILHDPPQPSQQARDLHLPQLQRVFDKALAKQRESRYQSCSEFSQDLDRLKARLESGHRSRTDTWFEGIRRWFN
ncbi:MAG TPA: serine/threonine-protein kinase [Terriglobales bacterium]